MPAIPLATLAVELREFFFGIFRLMKTVTDCGFFAGFIFVARLKFQLRPFEWNFSVGR